MPHSISNMYTNQKCDFVITKNNQNTLKGIVWGAVGVATCAVPLVLTSLSVAGVAATIFAKGLLHERSGLEENSLPALMAVGTCVSLIADYFAVKFTGGCLKNAFHHFGPQYSITPKRG